jgi:hypothetical protein
MRKDGSPIVNRHDHSTEFTIVRVIERRFNMFRRSSHDAHNLIPVDSTNLPIDHGNRVDFCAITTPAFSEKVRPEYERGFHGARNENAIFESPLTSKQVDLRIKLIESNFQFAFYPSARRSARQPFRRHEFISIKALKLFG